MHKITGSIKQAKIDDLKKQMSYVPDTYEQFFANIIDTGATAVPTRATRESGDDGTSDRAPLRKRSAAGHDD